MKVKGNGEKIMARMPRILAESNTYHIVMKSNNSEQLFFDDADYTMFLKSIKSACNEYDAKILAYCVMNNHIHLLIQFSDVNMSNVFKSFGASFAYKYNKKYNHSGSIFNGRYYSKAVDDEAYLLAVLRYIHYNPLKAGICDELGDYEWSSYNEYDSSRSDIASIDFIEELITREQFDDLHSKKTSMDNIVWDYIIESQVTKISEERLEEIFAHLKANYGCEELIGILKKMKIADKKVKSMLNLTKKEYEIYRK